MANLLYCEFLKLKRSKMFLISFFGALVAPIFMLANHIGAHFRRPDVIFNMASFYDDTLMFTLLLIGPIVYVVVVAYLFSREYTENTLKTILTIPIKKTTFIISKFAMLFVWLIFLSLISWVGTSIFSVIFHAVFGLSEIGAAVAFDYLVRFMLGGMFMFFVVTPFAFLAVWTKGFVVPLIAAAVVMTGNMMLMNTNFNAIYPWTIPAHFVLSNEILHPPVYPYPIMIGSIAIVSALGFISSVVLFHSEDVN
ncbi:MAG: ABC transporter permease [Defluviitaleaceae bacterium]|nr:ABC transporter permease [Defluviitaleaceae bacterium]